MKRTAMDKLNHFRFSNLLTVVYSPISILSQLWNYNHNFSTGFANNTPATPAVLTERGVMEKFEEQQFGDNIDCCSFDKVVNRLCKEGRLKEAVDILHLINRRGISGVYSNVYAELLQGCANMHSLTEGKRVHAHMNKTGFKPDTFLGNHLVNMYAKCGSIADARQLFDKMPERNVCSSNTMIAGYAKCGALQQARQVFDEMTERDVVSWTAIVAGYAQHGFGKEALELFRQMLEVGIKPNQFTFASVISVCSGMAVLKQGMQIHARVIRMGFELFESVGNALITMYANCRSVDVARQLFDRMPKRNAVSWNTMIAGYVRYGIIENARQLFDKMAERNVVSWTVMITGYEQHGRASEALQCFGQMLRAGIKPDQFTFGSVLSACAGLLSLEQGKEVHANAITTGFESNVYVGSVLADMYIKCESIEDAQQVFDRMPQRNVVSWTAMIVGYAQKGHGDKALNLFCQMQCVGMKPDHLTFASVLSACASLTALEQGKQAHALIVRAGFDAFLGVGNALVTMYAKSGSIDDAQQMFDKMPERDEVSWTAMIAGYAQHGRGREALQHFEQMIRAGMHPDHITFIGVLSACSHAGLVDEGCRYFDSMNKYHGITPRADHYACMIDLLGRAGRLDEAEHLIGNMPFEPDAIVWGALLGACRIHGNIQLGKRAAEQLFKMEPQNSSTYVMLSNTYAAASSWDDVAKVRKMMKDRGVKKEPGCSWIEVQNKVHAFVVGDRSHPQIQEINEMLESLDGQMKEAGYLADTNFVLHNVKSEEKERILCQHSEKLAVAFGLMNTFVGAPIRVIKNLRVCGDCHTAIKFISKIVRREIVVRDSNRFHHFKDGLCSCGDYW